MNKATKTWLIIATSLVSLGLITVAVVMTVNHWDFNMLSTVKYKTTTYEISEKFSNISMNTETADILFATSDDGICRVVCHEAENEKHSVAVKNGTLTVTAANERKWYGYIGITIGTPKITVYLPETEYTSLFIKESTGDIVITKDFKFKGIDISLSTGDVTNYASALEDIKIKSSTGTIRVENISANTLDLSVSTGKVIASDITCERDLKIKVTTGKTSLTDIKCKNVLSSGGTGTISLKNVIAAEMFSIERSTGDVTFDDCDAAEIFIETATGDVTGSLLTDKVFITETNTGNVEVPKTITGGKCEINTTTGNIKIKTD